MAEDSTKPSLFVLDNLPCDDATVQFVTERHARSTTRFWGEFKWKFKNGGSKKGSKLQVTGIRGDIWGEVGPPATAIKTPGRFG